MLTSTFDFCTVNYAFVDTDGADVKTRVEHAFAKTRVAREGLAPLQILFIAPHEYSWQENLALVQSRQWDWIHLSSAGYDFFPVKDVPKETFLTRTFSAYDEPITEYVLREILRFSPRGILGTDIGVIGFGNIGKNLAKVLQLLGANVTVLRQQTRGCFNGINHTDRLSDLYQCDQLALTLPLTADNTGLLGREFFQQCKPGINIINVSRGEHIDQDALVQLSAERKIHACLDVSTPEPLPAGHPLRTMKNIRLTEHIAWQNGDDENYFIRDFIKNLLLILGSEPPEGRIYKAETK
ncbi:NAD(P)-dependent oxidoreductase [Thalassomonas haliotis]|uniref:4-phosphoerythronate dehydrogenase n=1 Tax=Thalassomonas haliotis TaxID=485448 RepID=A0ABY7VEG4_9GAMM|nr:NAD(P)-dependent oxidoreductase [Thalassomonas haliotis]WDE11820.1 4-phosphoerythronate dehydrogenase [Thalassomonas haliotis]